MESNQPPKVLVMTWLDLFKESNDDDVIENATNMLIEAFGPVQGAADYFSASNIAV
jgi:hypothetical protein